MSGWGNDKSRHDQEHPQWGSQQTLPRQQQQQHNRNGNGNSGGNRGRTGSYNRHSNNGRDARDWNQQRNRPENRDYQSKNNSTNNAYRPPSSSPSNRFNEHNMQPDNVIPGGTSTSTSTSRNYNEGNVRLDNVTLGSKKKRRNHDKTETKQKKVKVEAEVEENRGTSDGSVGESTKKDESATAIIINKYNSLDSEAAKKLWQENLLACYRYPPDRQTLPIEAFTPDTNIIFNKKQKACKHAIEKVMIRMLGDAEIEMQKNDDDDSSNTDDSMYSMCRDKCHPADYFPYKRREIELFFDSVIHCTPLTIGFDVSGLRVEDDKNCHCPCDQNLTGWRVKFKLEGTVAGKESTNRRRNFCSKRKVTPIGLMSHVRKEGESCVLHYGIMHYMEHLYCMDTGTHRGGIGHKAMYQMNDRNWRTADAAEKKSLHQEIVAGRQQLEEEKTRRLRLEAERDKQTEKLKFLKRTNKDQFDKLEKLEKEREKLNVSKKKAVPELDRDTVSRYRTAFDAFFNTAKSSLRSLEDPKVEDKFDTLDIKMQEKFNMQQFFDEWYNSAINSNVVKHKRNASLLFHGLNKTKTWKNFYGRRIVDEWNISFEQTVKKVGEQDTTVDDGGPTREFLSQCWKQMGELRVGQKPGKEKDKCKKQTGVLLFETQENGVVPMTDDILRYKLKLEFPDETQYSEFLNRAKAYYRAIGRIMLHSLANNYTISSSALPPLYQNWLLRDCSPKDKDYDNDDVLKHLSDGGTGKRALYLYVGEDYEFEDGPKDVVTEQSIFTRLVPEMYLHSRRDAFKAIQEGLTLDGDYSLREFLRSFPLEAVQKVAFSSPNLAAKDVIAILEPLYCKGWQGTPAEGLELKCKQEAFFIDNLCGMLTKRGSSNSEKDLNFLSLFIKFCTGFDYLPDRDGNQEFKITVEFNFDEMAVGSYPVAHTCPKVLKLPGYLYTNGKEEFEKALDYAVTNYGSIFTTA